MKSERITPEQGFDILTNMPLEQIQRLAVAKRNQYNDANQVSYVVDTNPNYTNVCTADCLFCAFYRKPGQKGEYTKSLQEVRKYFEQAQKLGATTVLLQGGLHPDLKLDYYLEIIRMCVLDFPQITPHFFSAPEIQNIAEVNNLSIREVLQAFYNAGQKSLPGGGAEVLTQKVRNRISPKKQKVQMWFEVHKTAHQIGMLSTATMMYGHREENEDIIQHLEQLRQIQDETKGFTAFIPWSYKKDNTLLGKKITRQTVAEDYYRLLAFSRIYLDNIAHIQASWFSEGKEVGKKALHYGADDFGGTLFEENVHAETGFINKTSVQEVEKMIKESEFIPVQRDTFYNYLSLSV